MKIDLKKYEIAHDGSNIKIKHIRDKSSRKWLCTDEELAEYPLSSLMGIATCPKCIREYEAMKKVSPNCRLSIQIGRKHEGLH